MSRLIAILKCAGLTLAVLIAGSVTALAQMPDLKPLRGTGDLSASANPKQFTFVLAGDNRPADKSCKQPPTPGKIMSAVNQMNPPAAFVLWTGDTISGKQPEKPKLMRQQYAEFLDIAKQAGVPVFNAPGNHEMDDGDNCPSKNMQQLYEDNMKTGTYGAFTYGNSRFIALDSEHSTAPCKKPAKGGKKPDAPGSITDKELKLLEQDLDADKKLAHVFIFMHHPVKGYKGEDGLDDDSIAALEKLFKNYSNVSYVVSGHQHMYYNAQDAWADPPSWTGPSQPPFYLVSGGGGAPLKTDKDKKTGKKTLTPGSFFHYLIFKVDGNQVTPTLVKVDSKDPCDKKEKGKNAELQ